MMNPRKFFKALFFVFSSILLLFPSMSTAAMEDYCVTPPFVVAGVKPNLLLMIDNSASMYDPVYISTGTYCLDNTYYDSADYIGYFNTINTTTFAITYPTYSYSGGKFVAGAAMPASCTYGGSGSATPYVCVQMSGSGATRVVDNFIASGRFLNWLAASKLDVEKAILTGGKFDTTNQVLVGESRGCVGRRFIKTLPNLASLTFAVRGPGRLETDYVNSDTQGGLARIEIYEHQYNSDKCQQAVAAWDGSVLGQWDTAATDCFGLGAGNNPTGRELATFTESIKDCFNIKENIKNGLTAPDDQHLFKNVTINNLKTQCKNIYEKDCPADIATCTTLSKDTSGNWICSAVATHLVAEGVYASLDVVPGTDKTGFVGKCWKDNANQWPNDNTCVYRELLHFCSGYGAAEVIDPSQPPTGTNTTGNIPAIIIDAGARTLGDPIKPAGNADSENFFFAKVGSTAPRGLIQEFAAQNRLRFGAMNFNCIGSASESASIPGTCRIGANADAGKISSFISDNVGDHTTGLVKAIDDIVADSWTPYAEAYYNAISYFVKDATANPKLDPLKYTPDSSAISSPLPNTGSFTNGNPIQYRCQKNNVLIISDGSSTADVNSTMTGKVTTGTLFRDPLFLSEPGTCGTYLGSPYLHDLSYYAYHRSIFNPNRECVTSAGVSTGLCDNAETLSTYTVYTGPLASNLPFYCHPLVQMYYTSQRAGGTFQWADHPIDLFAALKRAFNSIAAGASSGTAASVLASGEGSGANLVQALFYPKRTFTYGLNSTTIEWTGALQNYWYYIDPFLGNSSIREDSNTPGYLQLTNDYIVNFSFDKSHNITVAKLFTDSDGDGIKDSSTPTATKCLDETLVGVNPSCTAPRINYLWEAGKWLFKANAMTDRMIYTTTDGTTRTTFNPPTDATSPLLPYLVPEQPTNYQLAAKIAGYTRGLDFSSLACSSSVTRSCGQDTDCRPPTCPTCLATETCTNYRNRTVTFEGVTNTWKLGDIVNSTPKISSWIPLNTYHKMYGDTSYGPAGQDPRLDDAPSSTHFITTSDYKSRGMVFVGANDGMLHAFKLGTIKLFDDNVQKASLVNPSTGSVCSSTDAFGSACGKEMWAFIPRQVLPYLRNMADPNYCHQYTVDAIPYILDASIANTTGCTGNYWNCTRTPESWKTVLIGGMRFGGACKNAATTYGVQTPASNKGYSAYFALDITNPTDPKVLWEFSNNDIPAADLATGGLGFSTTGPAIIKVSPKKADGTSDNTKNGRWFVVFGSGPTGPIDTVSNQFKGYSDQRLKFFVLDLATGQRLRTIDTLADGSTIDNAFAGAMFESSIDLDQKDRTKDGNYQDDALYVGYTEAETNPITAATKWTKGGVLRLVTRKTASGPESINPDPDWSLHKVIDNIGPVTASVKKLQNYAAGKEALWLFFGTGRYFYKISDVIDDANIVRQLYGVQDPCFTSAGIDPECDKKIGTLCAIVDPPRPTRNCLITDATSSGTTDPDGWFITLDKCTTADGTQVNDCSDSSVVYMTERMVTDPLATAIGAVFFTTTKPTADVCEFGGVTHLWAVNFDTGGAVKSGTLRGRALLQVSTGSIEEKDLSSAFTQKADASAPSPDAPNRRTDAIQGVPPAGSPPGILIPPKPTNRVIHMKER